MVQEQFELVIEQLLSDLGSATKLSIALDAWSAANHLSFLAIKAYYIDRNWQLREVLLDFIPLRGRHTGVSMSSDLMRVLQLTKTCKRLLAVTCDNAGNNSTLTRNLERKLRDEGITWSSAENAIPCLAHIINLVVQDIISYLKLAASAEMEEAEQLQRRHIRQIENNISVPNSLRKVRLFIT
jgi:hypothetical protein